MKRNQALQVIGAQMISAADGSAFTGSVSVRVTIDNGTQGNGAGTIVHKGNGFHAYVPTQAETDGNHIAFTFIGTGAIPATVQVYPTFPQTGDSFARLGAPAGASVSADIATIDAIVDAILVDTGTTLDTKIGSIDALVALIKAKTDSLTFTVAGRVDSNVRNVNNVSVAGAGTEGNPWGPAA